MASSTLYYPVGYQNSTEYGTTPDGNVTLTYTAGGRTAIVTLLCDESVNIASILTVGEFQDHKEHYYFYLTHRCACPGACVPPGLGGLSTGSVLVIIFFVVVIVYFLGGMMFLKFVGHKEGLDIIPNRSFWSSLPGLIKDGIVYFYNSILCWRSDYEKF
ncbi:uncharacterized protein TRIADDRAFT_63796 [Trichoplax adhaerens]|uniref:Cation-dependent mannose-6-phosphate receptor n=1 Tax=Trichoplax adhaerens TaxID=10228 RepID=B3RTA5_TRIAD|nr:hypothetical protein TRIADDRAFT_63796 [Trichoplax adhaerens]EDV26659.1 hypothetical protein TRIADDRAFT_63796 [Trichoplax adhaerens]|eukprot:XP_002110655.1 hypothetical protein TRIADDRAFT_63796 [Trichoplax adhaerens]